MKKEKHPPVGSKPIPEAQNYFIDDTGQLWSFYKGDFKVLQRNQRGYLGANIKRDDGTVKRISIHREVGRAFVPNPDNLPQIHHRDHCPSNNNASNLMWCDGKTNMAFRTAKGDIRKRRKFKDKSRPPCRNIRSYLSLTQLKRLIDIPEGSSFDGFFYEGLEFESLRALARHHEVHPETASNWLNAGKIQIIIDGVARPLTDAQIKSLNKK